MPTYERRYTGRRSKVAHLLPPWELSHLNHTPTALCGLWWWSASDAFGTGSQEEYERAEALPTCKTCERKAES